MNKFKYIWAGLTVAVLFLVACSPKHSKVPAVNQPTELSATNSAAPAFTNPAAVSPAPLVSSNILVTPPPLTNASLTNAVSAVISNANVPAATNLDAEYEKYQKGQITKGQMMQKIWAEDNNTPQDLFGKVIDQHGQPVTGADVKGSIELIQGFNGGEKYEVHKTQTDAEGLFQFTGLRGARLDADVEKKGYEMAYSKGLIMPNGSRTSPDNRAIFTMWKLKGAELMTHSQIHAYIPCDGSITRFDLLTGKKTANGDLTVKLTRNPVDIVRGRHFDWSITLKIANGGLQQITDLYPNEAPADGYQSEIKFDFPADVPKWDSFWGHSFYFQSRGGQIYGRIGVSITADFEPPPTLFDAEIYANPAGSRNLELDPGKVTQSH